jgi:hypothetical protein
VIAMFLIAFTITFANEDLPSTLHDLDIRSLDCQTVL